MQEDIGKVRLIGYVIAIALFVVVAVWRYFAR